MYRKEPETIDPEENNQEENSELIVQIGKYIRIEKIGEGGMGEIYKQAVYRDRCKWCR